MTRVLACAVLLMLARGTAAEAKGTVTLKYGSIKASVPVNATKAQQHQALLEAFSAQEAELANTVTNAISTHQWSLMAEEFGDPESKTKGDAPKIETWFLTNPKFEEQGRCMEKQLKKAGFAGYRFEVCSKEDVAETAQGKVDEFVKQLPQQEQKLALQKWCSHKRLYSALELAAEDELNKDDQPDYFLVLEDDAAIHEQNLKPMVEFLIKDLSDPRIAMFSGVKDWDFIQLDPYGSIGSPVGFIQGRPLYKPSTDLAGASRGAYQGSHAFLIKRSAIKKMNKFMKDSQATLVQNLPKEMPEFISVGSGVAVNKDSPFFAASTASRSCQKEGDAHKKEGDALSAVLGPDAKKAWWFPREEPKKEQHEHHSQHVSKEAKAEKKQGSSFLR